MTPFPSWRCHMYGDRQSVITHSGIDLQGYCERHDCEESYRMTWAINASDDVIMSRWLPKVSIILYLETNQRTGKNLSSVKRDESWHSWPCCNGPWLYKICCYVYIFKQFLMNISKRYLLTCIAKYTCSYMICSVYAVIYYGFLLPLISNIRDALLYLGLP